jgi:hypothetical protein
MVFIYKTMERDMAMVMMIAMRRRSRLWEDSC